MIGPVLVLGAAGMLGHKIFQLLSASCEVKGTLRTAWDNLPDLARTLLPRGQMFDNVDASDWQSLAIRIDELRPAVVINCIGIVKQRAEAQSAVPALTINALLPHRLAEQIRPWGGRLIHFSTDCVFSGSRGHYREDDQSDAQDLYGRSKFLGEVATANAVTLRTSVIGRELSGHRSLLEWFLSQRGRAVPGFRRAIYSGITTNEMAAVVQMIIADHPALCGVFQVGSEAITKYDLLVLLQQAYGIEMAIQPDDREVCDRSMDGRRFLGATGWRAPAWTEMVARLASDPTPYAGAKTRPHATERLELRHV